MVNGIYSGLSSLAALLAICVIMGYWFVVTTPVPLLLLPTGFGLGAMLTTKKAVWPVILRMVFGSIITGISVYWLLSLAGSMVAGISVFY